MKRREILIRLVVRERGDGPLGRTLVEFSRAITEVARAFTDERVVVEMSDVRGRELP